MRALLAVVLLSGCGGSLDAGFTGTWAGTSTVTLGGQTSSSAAKLTVVASGTHLTVIGMCTVNTGTLEAEGSGRSVTWTGAVACPPLMGTNCNSLVVTSRSGTIALQDNGSMVANLNGDIVGCGDTSLFSLAYVGTRL